MSGLTMGGATMGSPCSQKVYWQKTKLDRLSGSPVASLIRTCSKEARKQDQSIKLHEKEQK